MLGEKEVVLGEKKVMLGKLDRYMQKNEIRSFSYTIYKNAIISSKWFTDLYGKCISRPQWGVLLVQLVKDLVLSLQWFGSLVWCRLDPWPRNFTMLRIQPKHTPAYIHTHQHVHACTHTHTHTHTHSHTYIHIYTHTEHSIQQQQNIHSSFFSGTHRTFPRIDHMLGHKISLSKF